MKSVKPKIKTKTYKIVNGEVKIPNKVKIASNILAFVTGATCFLGTTGIIKSNINNVMLPSRNEIVQTIDDLDADIGYLTKDEEVLFNSSSVNRFIANKNQHIKIYAKDSVKTDVKNSIKNCVEYLNFIFEIINPNYKFEFVTQKNFGDYFDENFIVVEQKQIFTRKAVGLARTSSIPSLTNYGKKIYYNNIWLAPEVDKYESYNVFMHEIMHLFGFKDAYEIENYDTATIMQASGAYCPFTFLTNNDFKLLLALYSNNPNQNNEKYNELIKSKEEFNKKFASSLIKIIKNEIYNLLKQNGINESENAELSFVDEEKMSYYSVKNSSTLYAYNNHKAIKCSYEYDYSQNSKIWKTSEIKNLNNFNSLEELADFFLNQLTELPCNLILNYGQSAILIPTFCLQILYFQSPEIQILNNISKQEFETLYKINSGKMVDQNDQFLLK